MSPCAWQNFPVTTITELKSHFKHFSSQTISLGWGDAIGHQEVFENVILSVYNTQTMISASKGRYEMLLLQPVGLSLHVTTYVQENRRTTAHCQGTTRRAKILIFYVKFILISGQIIQYIKPLSYR